MHVYICTPITLMQAVKILEISQVLHTGKIWQFWLKLPNKLNFDSSLGPAPSPCTCTCTCRLLFGLVCLVVDAYYEDGE